MLNDRAPLVAFKMSDYKSDIVRIGILAALLANALFAVIRLANRLLYGVPTPWWSNALGCVALAALYRWYQHAPLTRITSATHVASAIATITVLIPLSYGQSSSVWWLALIGFALVLMASRAEALLWCAVTAGLLVVAPALVKYFGWLRELPESSAEAAISRLLFALVLFGIAFAFRAAVRKQNRQLRELAARVEASEQSKARFLQHMRHELRTPLHGVIALTDQALHGALEPAQRERIAGAQASASVLLRLLNDVFEFASSSGTQVGASGEFSAWQVLLDTAAALSVQARDKKLSLRINVADGWSEPRSGNVERFQQIVYKLASNALQFTKAGSVELKLAPCPEPIQGMILSVTDTGVGISKALQESLFQPFARGDLSSTRIAGGLGLGLALVRELAEGIGGRISCESTPEHGTRFEVFLPIGPAPAALPVTPAIAPKAPSEPSTIEVLRLLKVLVCEDDAVCQFVLVEGLRFLGHDATAVADGESGWQRLQIEHFDALLTDIEMPKLDGNALLKRIRGDAELNIPVVAVTACAAPSDAVRIIDSGFDGWLPKPFLLADLQRILSSVTPRNELWRSADRCAESAHLP